MNKEKVLEMSRQENKEKDLFELEVNKKASTVGICVAAIICGLLFAAEIFICGTPNYGLWSIIATIIGVIYLYSGMKLKDKGKLTVGVMFVLITVGAIAYAISNLFATSTIL